MKHKFCDDCIIKAFTFSNICPACLDTVGLITSKKQKVSQNQGTFSPSFRIAHLSRRPAGFGEFLIQIVKDTPGARDSQKFIADLIFFLVSQSILGISTHTDIIPGFKTDHSLITLSLSLHSNPRGNGFWKLNTSLLADNNFIETIKIAIQEKANEYKYDNLVNPLLLWDIIKLKVREKSITYSASIKKAKVKKEEELEKKIAMLEKRLDNACSNDPPVSQNVTERIKILKEELEKIIENRTKGAILRPIPGGTMKVKRILNIFLILKNVTFNKVQ